MGTKPNVLENLKLSFDLKETAASTETETTEQQSKLKNIAIEEPTGDTFVRSKSGLADNLSEIDEKRLETIFKRLRVGCHVHGTKESKETTRFRSRAKLRPTNMYR